MLILEKTATSVRQTTPHLDYENVIIENLGVNPVYVQTIYTDMRKPMVDYGAVVEKIEAYSQAAYVGVALRRKKWFGLISESVIEVGYVTFWTDSASVEIRIRAFNGQIEKFRQWAGLKSENVLKGYDDTIVSTTADVYTLIKEITVYNVPSTKPISSLIWDERQVVGTGTASIKLTGETNSVSETVEDEHDVTETDYDLQSLLLSAEYYGEWVTIRVYGKGTGTTWLYSELLKLYGDEIDAIFFA
uniref:Uncharacterized protein n=1 Tax=viral metagenome TaxID=1070528 RepID=A0A6M3LCV7_9ZZZZ